MHSEKATVHVHRELELSLVWLGDSGGPEQVVLRLDVKSTRWVVDLHHWDGGDSPQITQRGAFCCLDDHWALLLAKHIYKNKQRHL